MRRKRWFALLCVLVLCAAHTLARAARADDDRKPRSIAVVGTGRERSAPDTAELTFTVERTAPAADAAAQDAAKTARRVIEVLRKEAGQGARVETAGFSLSPVYEPQTDPRPLRRDEPPKIVGYTATHDIWVQSPRVDGVGTIIDAAIGAGASRIRSLAFTVADPAPLHDRALAAAGADAARQARAAAAALGVRLTTVLSASVEDYGRPILARGAAFAAESRVETPIQPGEVTTEVRLQVSYGIE